MKGKLLFKRGALFDWHCIGIVVRRSAARVDFFSTEGWMLDYRIPRRDICSSYRIWDGAEMRLWYI